MNETPTTAPAASAGRIALSGCLVRTLLAGVLGTGLGVGIALVMAKRLDGDTALHECAFDSARWLDAKQSTASDVHFHTLRQAMARDLVERVLKPGMSREELHALLGTSSRWPIFDAAAWWGAEDEAFWLGKPDQLVETGDVWLWLDFDAGGKLARAKIVGERAAAAREP